MKRSTAVLTASVLSLGLLTACSGEETAPAASDASSESPSGDTSPGAGASADPDAAGAGSKYCELLSTDFATLFTNIKGPEDVAAAVGIIEDIVAEAPEEVADEWRTMSGALGQMEGALTKAAELQKRAQSGEVPPEELQKETAALMKDMEALDTPENNEAGNTVSTHATEYCGLDLG